MPGTYASISDVSFLRVARALNICTSEEETSARRYIGYRLFWTPARILPAVIYGKPPQHVSPLLIPFAAGYSPVGGYLASGAVNVRRWCPRRGFSPFRRGLLPLKSRKRQVVAAGRDIVENVCGRCGGGYEKLKYVPWVYFAVPGVARGVTSPTRSKHRASRNIRTFCGILRGRVLRKRAFVE